MNLERAIINLKSLSIPTQWQLTKAKREYLKTHRECAICKHIKNLEVHHIIPIHIDSSKALDPNNFITLCDSKNNGCHYIWGHFRNFRTKWNPNIIDFSNLITQYMNMYREDIITKINNFTSSNTNQK